jgi:hypothetical protein
MDHSKNSKMREIAKELGIISELVLMRKPPFKNIPIYQEVANPHFIKYYKYSKEIDKEWKNKIIGHLIESAKWLIKEAMGVVDNIQSYDNMFPDYADIRERFQEWIIEKEGAWTPKPGMEPPVEKIKVIQIVRGIVKEQKPDFKYDSRIDTDFPTFSKEWTDNNKCFFCVDKGGMSRRFFSCYLGVESPFFMIDLSYFFAGSQSWFQFNTTEEVEASTIKALEIFDMLLPPILKRVEKYVGRVGP